MLSLLLNKNPWLSLRVVSHRLLWSLVVWQEGASEVSRQEDRSIDKPVERWIDGQDSQCDFLLTYSKSCISQSSLLEIYKMFIEYSVRTSLIEE